MAHTVLVMDREPMVRRSLALLLETYGFTVALASDVQAVKALSMRNPDILMVEVCLLEQTGEMAVPRSGAKVIGMYEEDPARHPDLFQLAQRLGAHALIAKPFGEDDPLQVLHELLLPSSRAPELELVEQAGASN